MSILLMYLIPFVIGIWIGVVLKSWSVIAIMLGIPMFMPSTAVSIASLVASSPDSIFFYIIPSLGAGMTIGGSVGMVRLMIGKIRRTPN